jgi:hypothetical protein
LRVCLVGRLAERSIVGSRPTGNGKPFYPKKRNVKRMKERLNFQRSIYRHQFCQDNKLIFSRKVWKFLKKHEMHLYQNGKRILFNNKTWNSINKNEGIAVDSKSFNKVWNNKFLIQSFMGTIDS